MIFSPPPILCSPIPRHVISHLDFSNVSFKVFFFSTLIPWAEKIPVLSFAQISQSFSVLCGDIVSLSGGNLSAPSSIEKPFTSQWLHSTTALKRVSGRFPGQSEVEAAPWRAFPFCHRSGTARPQPGIHRLAGHLLNMTALPLVFSAGEYRVWLPWLLMSLPPLSNAPSKWSPARTIWSILSSEWGWFSLEVCILSR